MPIGMDFHSPWMLVENDPHKKLLFMLNIRLSTKNKNKSQILSDTHTHITNPIRKTLFETIFCLLLPPHSPGHGEFL